MKKYILIGGQMMSKSDGDIHYVSATKLCKLYRLNLEECYFYEDDNPSYKREIRGLRHNNPELKILFPRYNGDYEIKKEEHQ